jgi:hypothetical protein
MAGAGYIVVPRPGAKKEQAATADPAIIVELTDCGDGSTYVLYVRNAMDEIGVAPDNIRKQWEPMIDQKFRMAACRYVTFRALFGGWANGAMLYGSTQKALEKRLVSLGGTLKARAGELSQALVPQTMKK